MFIEVEFYIKIIGNKWAITCKKRPAWKVHFSGGSTSLEQCNSSVSKKRAKNKINCNNITLFSMTETTKSSASNRNSVAKRRKKNYSNFFNPLKLFT
jgi:hypothetical protein